MLKCFADLSPIGRRILKTEPGMLEVRIKTELVLEVTPAQAVEQL